MASSFFWFSCVPFWPLLFSVNYVVAGLMGWFFHQYCTDTDTKMHKNDQTAYVTTVDDIKYGAWYGYRDTPVQECLTLIF
jgi:hypothetical protein